MATTGPWLSTPSSAEADRRDGVDVGRGAILDSLSPYSEAQFDFAPDGILIVDEAGDVLRCNHRFLELWGVNADWATQPLRTRLNDLPVQPTDQVRFRNMARTLAEQPAAHYHDSFDLSDGRCFDLISQPLHDASGRRLGRILYYRDITELRAKERALASANALLESLFAVSPDAVLVIDDRQQVTRCNERFLELSGFDAGWIARPQVERQAMLSTLVADPEAAKRFTERWMDDPFAVVSDTFRLRDGRRVHVDAIPLGDVGEARGGRVFYYRDISRFANSNELGSLRVLAGGVAHNVNNALTAIQGNAYLALQEGSDSPVLVDALRGIDEAAGSVAAVVRDLLALSNGARIGGTVDVNAVMHRASVPQGRLAGIDVRPSLHARPLLVAGDEASIAQALGNLLLNAAEAGAVSVQVITKPVRFAALTPGAIYAPMSPPPGEYACVEVADDGEGISPEASSQLFEPFASPRTTHRGLGLPAVAAIMRQHGGSVEVNTSLERGAIIRLLFPLSERDAAAFDA